MRIFEQPEEKWLASNPGRIRVKPVYYSRFFPKTLTKLLLGVLLVLLGLVGAVITKGISLVALLIGVRWIWHGFRKIKGVARHFFIGCVLPGVVVSVDPITIASLTDLSIEEHISYQTLKIVTMPKLAKVKGRTFATGDRLPVVALYSGNPPTPKWNNFHPSPAIFATDDPSELARVEASITEREWQDLNEALFQIPKPYRNGLFPVNLPEA